MSKQELGAKEFIIGAVIGSLIGTAGALLLTPKKGKTFRRDLANFYDRTQNMAGNLHERAGDWTNRAKSLVGDLKECIGCSEGEEESHGHSKVFTIGALAGGILGAVTALMLAPKPGDELRDDILDKYQGFSDRTQSYAKQFNKTGKCLTRKAKSKTHAWLDLAKNVMDEVFNNGDEITDNLSEKVKDYTEAGHDHLSNALEWASIGLKVLNTLSKRR